MKVKLENSKISGRCLHCGKKRVNEFGAFCSNKCKDKMEKKKEEWEKQGLCVWGCGKPVYVSKKDGHKYRACYDCLFEMSLAMKELDKLESLAMGEENGE